jgi:hypothetical protein
MEPINPNAKLVTVIAELYRVQQPQKEDPVANFIVRVAIKTWIF